TRVEAAAANAHGLCSPSRARRPCSVGPLGDVWRDETDANCRSAPLDVAEKATSHDLEFPYPPQTSRSRHCQRAASSGQRHDRPPDEGDRWDHETSKRKARGFVRGLVQSAPSISTSDSGAP